MKNLIAITIATALAACGGSVATGVGRAPVSVDFYGAMPFNQVTGATIKVFSDSAGSTQVGTNIAVPACSQPYSATTANCFDGGNLSTFAGGTTTLTADLAAGDTAVTAATAGLQLYGNVTLGVGPIAETVQVTAITDATHFTVYPAIKNAHRTGEYVVNAIRPPKFFGYSLELPGSTGTGTNYWISILYFNGVSQVGLADRIKVSVVSGKVNTVPVSAANTYTSAKGVVITASTGFVTYLALSGTKPMSVTAVDPSGGTLSYAWDSAGCGSFDATNVASVTFTAPGTTNSSCTVTVTVSSSNAGIPTATKTATINVANDVVINEGAAPPQINQIVISSGNPADTTCTLSRAAAPCTGNACWPAVSCPIAFAVPTAALNKANGYLAQSYFLNVGISANLGGEGFNPNAPPAASATVDCPNDRIDFPLNSKGLPAVSVAFPAGYAVGGAVNGNANEWGTDSYFLEPTFTFAKGVYDGSKTYVAGDLVIDSGFVWTALVNANLAPPGEDATAWSKGEAVTAITTAHQTLWTRNGTAGMCTVSVKVTNQSGGADSVPVGVYFQ